MAKLGRGQQRKGPYEAEGRMRQLRAERDAAKLEVIEALYERARHEPEDGDWLVLLADRMSMYLTIKSW